MRLERDSLSQQLREVRKRWNWALVFGKEKRMERLAGGSQKCILGDVNKECV